jgi:hypothetical protein
LDKLFVMPTMCQRIILQGVLLTSAFLLLGTEIAWAQFAPDPPQAPKALRPPKGQALLIHLHGRGTQIYVCESSAGVFAWKFKAPEAELFGESGELAGRHFAGPTWEGNDGSRVIARVAASVPSPASGSIPWLLLTAIGHDDKGIMARVQSIQRLDTKGGVAPSASCGAANRNEETAVPYEADYYFYGVPRSGVLQNTSK